MKSLSSRTFWLEFWEERGEKLMTCHLFLWQFFLKFHDLCVVFKGWEFFETDFSFKRTLILNLVSWNVRLFWISSFAKDVFNCRKLIVFSCLQFADCYIWPRIFVMWSDFFCFNHYYGNLFLEKFSLRKSWCCRKHVYVFEIVSLKYLNKFDQIIFFFRDIG